MSEVDALLGYFVISFRGWFLVYVVYEVFKYYLRVWIMRDFGEDYILVYFVF